MALFDYTPFTVICFYKELDDNMKCFNTRCLICGTGMYCDEKGNLLDADDNPIGDKVKLVFPPNGIYFRVLCNPCRYTLKETLFDNEDKPGKNQESRKP